ncbi:hypothetical protein BC941DRAFT_498701, partial [Chlamydoabsidia padenii]
FLSFFRFFFYIYLLLLPTIGFCGSYLDYILLDYLENKKKNDNINTHHPILALHQLISFLYQNKKKA